MPKRSRITSSPGYPLQDPTTDSQTPLAETRRSRTRWAGTHPQRQARTEYPVARNDHRELHSLVKTKMQQHLPELDMIIRGSTILSYQHASKKQHGGKQWITSCAYHLNPRGTVRKWPRDAAMNAEYVVIDYRRQGKTVEHSVTPFPYLLPQIFSEPILAKANSTMQKHSACRYW